MSRMVLFFLATADFCGSFKQAYFLGGGTNERPVTDHVTSGPMRGLKKLHPMTKSSRHTDGHGDSMTELAQWGQFNENEEKRGRKLRKKKV